ncbi:MAG TPA: hypothetical protein VN635_03950 [Conexibacter sp.]|nr:hypothetical protein [Conexibacter sp.]
MGNKVALALLLLAAIIIMSACGGTQGTGLGAATTATTASHRPLPRNGHTNPNKSCESQGINSTQLGTGACTEGGVQYVVANYGGVVRLRTLAAAIVRVTVGAADKGHGRVVTPRRDAFLRVTLQVQNLGRTPQRFNFGQTMLGIGGDDYGEATGIERTVHLESIATANGGVVGPGETLRGDVLFDITRADYEQLNRTGRFFIWNFGGHATPQLVRGAGQVGQIRLYAGETG